MKPIREASSTWEEDFTFENLPEIAELSLDQRYDLTNILIKKHSALLAEIKDVDNLSEKDLRKKQEQLQKIEEKMEKAKTKTDEKIKKFLTAEQY